jgi:putative inorganic carbon (HCO3(-)) transporter
VNLAIPFALFLVFEAETMRGRLFYTGVLLVLVLSVVGTSSRGGTLALAAVGLYYWLKSDKKVLTGFIVVVAIGIVFAVAPPMYFQRMQTITDQTEGSAQGRIMAWKSGVRMAIDHPFLGVGAGHFPVKYGVEYRPPNVGPTEIPWQTAHSIYFVILGELGFPGLFVLLFFIGYNLVANRRLAREVVARGEPNTATDVRLLACLSAGVIAFAVGGAFLTAIYYPHMYVLAGLLAAGRRIVRERHERPASSEHDLLGDVMPLPVGAR